MPTTNYPLRVPASIMEEAKKAAAQDGVSLNQFINTVLAEKVSALRAEAVLRERARRADRRKFDEVMFRAGGTPPREGDELPDAPQIQQIAPTMDDADNVATISDDAIQDHGIADEEV